MEYTLLAVLVIGFILYSLYKNKNPQPDPTPIPPPKPKPKPEPQVKLIDVPVINRRIDESSVYADIINHAHNPVLDEGRSTNGHETVHMINSYYRNKKKEETGNRYNSFYVAGIGKIFQAIEPKIKKSDVAEFVPKSLRGMRYSMYVTGQRAWDDTPLYLVDEFSAYVASAHVCVDDVLSKRYNENRIGCLGGMIEFVVYSTALCMTIEKYDEEYFTNNIDFINFIEFMLEYAKEIYNEGRNLKEFDWKEQVDYINRLKTSNDAEEMRNFMKKYLNEEWLV